MGLDLSGVNAKIARAEEHAVVLEEELWAWGRLDPYRFSPEFNSDYTRLAFVVRKNPAVSLTRASLVFGDCLHNLRCALDHLAHAMAANAHQGPNPLDVGKKFGFIIADNEPGFRAQSPNKDLPKFLSPSAIDAMESIQPYRRPYETSRVGLLALLRDLNNSDKHRLLLDLVPSRGDGHLKAVSNPDGAIGTYSAPADRPEDGKEFCFVTFDRPAPRVKYDGEMRLLVGVEHGGNPWYTPGLPNLLLAEVRYVVQTISTLIGGHLSPDPRREVPPPSA